MLFSPLHDFLSTLFLRRVNNILFNALKPRSANGNTAWGFSETVVQTSTEQPVRWALGVAWYCHVLASNVGILGSYCHKGLNLLCWIFGVSTGLVFKTLTHLPNAVFQNWKRVLTQNHPVL